MNDEANLMDRVHKLTYSGAKIRGKRLFFPSLTRYRMELRRAHKYVLDAEASRIAARLSQRQEKMRLWSVLARLPFDAVWLEFDLHAMMRELDSLGTLRKPFKPEEVAPRTGFLLAREAETRWWATEFTEFNEANSVFPEPVTFVFDPDGSPLTPVTGSTSWNQLSLSALAGEERYASRMIIRSGETETEVRTTPESIYFGSFWDGSQGAGGIPLDQPFLSPLHFKIGAVPEPTWLELLADDERELVSVVAADADERAGGLRRLVTILGMINEVPDGREFVSGRPGRMSVGSHSLPYFGHSVVRIRVPKRRNPVKYVERIMNRNARAQRRRAHSVAGFWRMVQKGTGHALECRHVPSTEAVDGVSTCLRCGRRIRWIPSYTRGDATLGWVYQDERRITGR